VVIWVKPYVEADATPKVKEQIQGEEVAVPEDEFITRPEYWKQRVIQDFIEWLRGKPSLAPHTSLEIRHAGRTVTVRPGEAMPVIIPGVPVPEREIRRGRKTAEELAEERRRLWEESARIIRRYGGRYWAVV